MLDAFRAESNSVEGIAQHLQIGETGSRDVQLLPFPIEQPDAQLEFERFHLMAYRALRHGQLFRRLSEALMTCRRLEGFEGIERWQSASQFRTVMKKIGVGTRNHALRPLADWSISAPHVNVDAAKG